MGLLSDKYLNLYLKDSDVLLNKGLQKLQNAVKENNFNFLLNSSAVFSSNIEGNSIDLNSFLNLKNDLKFTKPKEVKEIDNLIQAYSFAKENFLTEENFLNTHKIISEELLIESKRGKYREEPVGVYGQEGLIYVAIEPENVKNEMEVFFEEINDLIKKKLTINEIFYYASLIHLRFVHIHPFMDGNGRCARLLEKWFVSRFEKEKAWFIQSERYYCEHRAEYYKNINLGTNYYELNYNNCINFLLMLPNALNQ